jgi:hypothetical protein
MSDVFISYAYEDRPVVAQLVAVFEQHGVDVWWDRSIQPGRAFDDAIEAALDAAKCVVVVWSRHSVKSRWVRAEAAEGERRSILIPVQIESAMLPLEFRRLQTPQLIGWTGASQHPELLTLLRAIREVLGTAHDSTQLPSPAPAAMAMESQRKSPLEQPSGTPKAIGAWRYVAVFLFLAFGLWFLGLLFQLEAVRWVMIILVGVYLCWLYVIKSGGMVPGHHRSWVSEAKRASQYLGVFLPFAFVLWFFGPFVVLGDLRLIESPEARGIVIAFLAVCLAGLFVYRR